MVQTRATQIPLDDEAAFAESFQQYKNLVFKTAYLLLDSAEDAEDVLQEVFVQVYRNRRKYDPSRGALSTWIHRITVNLCNSRRRKAAWRHWITKRLGKEAPFSPSPEEQLGDTAIRMALQRMNDNLRTVLVLRYYNDLTYREIAEVLNIPEGTAKSRANYAIATLRKQLQRGNEEVRGSSQEEIS